VSAIDANGILLPKGGGIECFAIAPHGLNKVRKKICKFRLFAILNGGPLSFASFYAGPIIYRRFC
jgi:hypothetical protein